MGTRMIPMNSMNSMNNSNTIKMTTDEGEQ